MKKFLENFSGLSSQLRHFAMLFALIVIIVFFQVVTGGILLRPINLSNLVQQNSHILILAIGMLFVIISGSIDLSVGSVVAFIGAISAVLTVNMHVNPIVATLLCLLAGLLIGAWHGFWIAYVKIPSFIVTLAGMLLFRGLTLTILGGQSIGPLPKVFQIISSKFLPDIAVQSPYHILTLAISILLALFFIVRSFFVLKKLNKDNSQHKQIRAFLLLGKALFVGVCIVAVSLLFAEYKGYPNILLFLVIIIAIYHFIAKKTVWGRRVYAIGGNWTASKLSGIRSEKMMFQVFCNMGLLSAVAGVVFASRLNVATPGAGISFELDAIAACFIGGASTKGGVGFVTGAIVGGLVMGVLNNGMSIMGVGIDWQQSIKGLVLLLAVLFDLYQNRFEKR